MKPETLSRELVQIAAEITAHEVPESARARVSILKDAAGPLLAEAGFLAANLELRMLDGRVPCDRVLHEVCQAALDRWLGKARQSIEVSADHEFVEWLARFRANDSVISPQLALGLSTSPQLAPSDEPEEVIVTSAEHPGDLPVP